MQMNGGAQAGSLFQRVREIEGERNQLVQKMLARQADDVLPDSVLVQQIQEKDASLKFLLEVQNPMPDFVKLEVKKSVWKIFHNVNQGKDTQPFEMMYFHPDPIKFNDSFEVRVEDLGEKWEKSELTYYDIGIGVCSMASYAQNKNRAEFGFDIGVVSSDRRVMHLDEGGKREILDCPDSVLIQGDVIKCAIGESSVVFCKGGERCSAERNYAYNDMEEYKIFIGLKNRYAKVTLAVNTSFEDMCQAHVQNFPKDDVRIYVASMNESSPGYAKGVSNGGKQLLRDGMLVRRLRQDGRRIINYQAGLQASTYDAKLGGHFTLEELLPKQLIRNRFKLSGNMLTITRRGGKEYRVIVHSLLSGHEERFIGTSEEWEEQKDRLLSTGEKFVIDLPTPNGMVQANDLLIAGTKCKTIRNMIHLTLSHKVEDRDKTPAVLLLGGDRSMSVGSISGALRTYEDLCVLFFDAHNDIRDPNASQYPVVHGSTLFFLLQRQLRVAITEWNNLDANVKQHYPETVHAIKFLQSTREGRAYWEDLQNPDDYRGFNWLRDSEQINPRRMAFVGVRQTEMEAGSSLGSPLVGLFSNLLKLKQCMYPHDLIKSVGVAKIFKGIIEQFRSTFPDIQIRDLNHPDGYWIPPIMVSWDVDSIDPHDLPCTIFQEADGLTSEECLAFCDEVALTKRLVLFETIEFNPDLWEGYRDEKVIMTINEFEAGPYARSPREPADKNKHRLDLQTSMTLLKDMIQRAFISKPVCIESGQTSI